MEHCFNITDDVILLSHEIFEHFKWYFEITDVTDHAQIWQAPLQQILHSKTTFSWPGYPRMNISFVIMKVFPLQVHHFVIAKQYFAQHIHHFVIVKQSFAQHIHNFVIVKQSFAQHIQKFLIVKQSLRWLYIKLVDEWYYDKPIIVCPMD